MKVIKLKFALALSVFISLITSGIGNAIADETHGLKKGQDAINFLGEDKINQKAAKSGMKPEQLKKQLLNDKTMHVNDQGDIVFIDKPSSNAAPTTTNSVINTTTVRQSFPSLDNYTPDQVFTLHSKPGSNRTIYLRFIGADLTNTAWAGGSTLIMPPYDYDGNPTAFSIAERQDIIQIWQRVSEDYAPFDVDVTTELPTEDTLTRTTINDSTYDTYAVITNAAGTPLEGATGIAFLGSFNFVTTTVLPALIIGDSAHIAHDAKKVAEITSHEVGHTLGLSNDGTTTLAYYEGHGSGETGWAPIRGTAYYQNLTQFSNGEYPDANNQQDDITVIAANGAPLRDDDHGNTIATATNVPCDTSGSTDLLANLGTDDIDVFKLHLGAGSLNVDVVKPIGTNSDTELTVYDSLGSVIAVDNPIDLLGNTLTASIAQAGDYYIALKGVGKGDLVTGYSSYGSLGINQIHLSSYFCDIPPTVNAGPDKLNIPTDSTVVLSAQGTGNQLTYKWTIITTPKNSKSALTSPNTSATSFVPDKVGDYILTVIVKDNVGRTSSDSVTVSVVKKNAD